MRSLQNQVARWQTVNNDLYQFCVSQLLAVPNADEEDKNDGERLEGGGFSTIPSASKKPRLGA